MGRRASVRAPATSPNASWFLLTAVTGRPESPPLDEGRVACRPGRVAAPPGESPLHPVSRRSTRWPVSALIRSPACPPWSPACPPWPC